MGSKLSCFHRGSIPQQVQQPAQARVIAADGSLKELAVAASPHVAVSDVLRGDAASFFMCNSDALYFNENPRALAAGEGLRPGQLYFVLPAAMLGRPLSSADMAALAVRASAALAAKKPQRYGRGGGKKKVRVMPVHEDHEDVLFNERLNEQTLGEFAKSLSLLKSDETLAPAAAPSRLKRALSVIEEDAE